MLAFVAGGGDDTAAAMADGEGGGAPVLAATGTLRPADPERVVRSSARC